MTNKKLIKEYETTSFGNRKLSSFIKELQKIEQKYPSARIHCAVGGFSEPDSIYITADDNLKEMIIGAKVDKTKAYK